jgi:hypothetical protein
MRKRVAIGAALLIGVGVFLGAAVFRDQVAQATGLAQGVTVINTPDDPIPAQEQNRDGSGNIKVHEQGTADVNVTNKSLSVDPAAPITDGGDALFCPAQLLGNLCSFSSTRVASALSIHMTAGVASVALNSPGGAAVGVFEGPLAAGNASIDLALTRPITVSAIFCRGLAGNDCSVSLIGNSP